MRTLLLLLFLLVGCDGVRLGKFQLLVPEARFTGTVVLVRSPGEWDLDLDPEFVKFSGLFPMYGGIVHCELYGHDGIPAGDDIPGVFDLKPGDHISLIGALVLDNSAHQRDANPGATVRRFLYEAAVPQPEIHPYRLISLQHDPAPPKMREVFVRYYGETYLITWFWNRWICGGSICGVSDSLTTTTIDVGE